MRISGLLAFTLACFLSALIAAEPAANKKSEPAEVFLDNGLIVDGTGGPSKRGDVALKGDRIVAVGDLKPGPNAKVIDASKWVIAPGFIDLHSHSDPGMSKSALKGNLNYQAQGVTTVVTGNCGGGVVDVAKYLDAIDANGAGTNVIHLIPHGAVRSAVMGNEERIPTPQELDRMAEIVERGMKAGAWGISSGLIYVPSRYAQVHEPVSYTHLTLPTILRV